jgi:hypothetical protein
LDNNNNHQNKLTKNYAKTQFINPQSLNGAIVYYSQNSASHHRTEPHNPAKAAEIIFITIEIKTVLSHGMADNK